MSWRVYAGIFDTADLTSPNFTQKFNPISKNIMMDRVRVWLTGFNSPSFSYLNMKLYADRSGSSGKLIAVSLNQVTQAALETDLDNVAQPYWLTETYFEFDKLPLKSTENYHLAIQGVGYTFSASSYLGWVKAWPDAVYRQGLSQSSVSMGVDPYTAYFRGAEI